MYLVRLLFALLLTVLASAKQAKAATEKPGSLCKTGFGSMLFYLLCISSFYSEDVSVGDVDITAFQTAANWKTLLRPFLGLIASYERCMPVTNRISLMYCSSRGQGLQEMLDDSLCTCPARPEEQSKEGNVWFQLERRSQGKSRV